jgi:hypothetical protein
MMSSTLGCLSDGLPCVLLMTRALEKAEMLGPRHVDENAHQLFISQAE